MENSIIETALTPEEVKRLYSNYNNGAGIDIWEYNQVISTDNVDSLFNSNPYACIIFYPFAEINGMQIGHYVALVRNGDHTEYYYYDSLAYKPDEYKSLSDQRAQLYKERLNSLIKLFLDKKLDGVLIDYNTNQVQSRSSNISTCGRWAALRCSFYRLSNDEFNTGIQLLRKVFNLKGKYSDNIFLHI